MRENPPLSLTVTFCQLVLLLWVTFVVNSGDKAGVRYSHTSAITPNIFTANTYSVTQTLNLHKYTPTNKNAKSVRNVSSYLHLIVVATSADIELNPGPQQIKYPCGTCGKAVTWKQKGIRCDNSDCGQWYHTTVKTCEVPSMSTWIQVAVHGNALSVPYRISAAPCSTFMISVL